MAGVIKKVCRAYHRMVGHYATTIAGVTFKLDPYHIDFWKSAGNGTWEPQTYKILSTFLKPDSTYCDVGGWIGPTVIYAAKHCKKVICFEPDPVAYRFLRWNIELNQIDNVSSFNVALSSRSSMQRMASFGGSLGDSMTSLLNANPDKKGIDALTLTWNDFVGLTGTGKIDVLKIDIEGGEFDLLPSLKDYLAQHKPVIYLSTHAPFLDADSRKEKMQLLVDVLGMYGKCLDENQKVIDLHTLVEEHSLNNFCSFVFTD